MRRRALPFLLLALGACDTAPPPAVNTLPQAASPATTQPVSVVEPVVGPSASLAGVAEDADAEPADLDAAATWRLPGRFTRHVSRDWLEQRFGAAHVRVADVPGAEGETSRGVILFADDPARRAYVYFNDEAHLRGLAMLRVMDAGSRWRLDNGVAPGMPLSALVALNGQPIAFTGFDWDYGGVVSDWHGGRLAPRADTGFRRTIRLDHRTSPDGGYPIGDDTYASDDRRYPHLGDVVIVGEIGIAADEDSAVDPQSSNR